jgi:hypothetical protein
MIVVLTHLSVTGRQASSPERARLAALSLLPKQVGRLTLTLVQEN